MKRAALLLGVLAMACGDPAASRVVPPTVDALVSAGDSLFWLRSDSTGFRLRGVAMTLALIDGRFHEIYTADDDRSFYDAVFVGQQIYRRDLEAGDSTLVVADTLIPRLAAAYAAANPRERPLRSDEPANEHPRTIGTVEFHDLDIVGPYLSYEYRVEVDVVGGNSVRATRRGIADLRTGAPATVTTLFGTGTAKQMLSTAKADLDATGDAEAWRIDAASFALTGSADTVLVTFAAVAIDPDAGDATLPLTPIAVPAPEWWRLVAHERPRHLEPERRFVAGDIELAAVPNADDGRAQLRLRDAADRVWDAGQVSGDVRRVYWLDSTVTPATRRALVKAFDEAVLYSGQARIVRGPPARRPAPTFVSLASYPLPPRVRR